MKKLVKYQVDLFDYEADLPLPGAETFLDKYTAWQVGSRVFSFEQAAPTWEQAAADLRRAGLAFLVSYAVQLDPAEEATYPAFWLNPPTEFNLINFTQPPRVNPRALASGLADDITSDTYILTPAFLAGLTKFGIELTALPAQTPRKRQAWLVKQFPALPEPYEIYTPVSLTEGKKNGVPTGTYFPTGWDSRLRLSPATMAYLKQHHLGQSNEFRYKGQLYQPYAPSLMVSGALAQWLRTHYGSHLQIRPATLASIWESATTSLVE